MYNERDYFPPGAAKLYVSKQLIIDGRFVFAGKFGYQLLGNNGLDKISF